MVTEVKRMSLVKPTLHTCYHIDFEWWQKNDRDWHVYLRNYLCKEHQAAFASASESVQIDWVDPNSAEITQVDGLQHVLNIHCAKEPDFITQQTALVDAIFRIFLANGNQPLSSEDLAKILNRPAQTILRTLSGAHVLQGIRIATG